MCNQWINEIPMYCVKNNEIYFKYTLQNDTIRQ